MTGPAKPPHHRNGDHAAGTPATIFRGRRRGRRLRPDIRRLLEERLPGFRISPDDAARHLDPEDLFGASFNDLWMEIGFGAGEHLVWQACHHRDIAFIGCEPYINGVAGLLRAVVMEGLDNVRILADDVRPFFRRLPDACLGRLFVLFPDPWPKRRHHGRRLVQWETVAEFHRLLRSGGEVRFATDDPDYLRWILVRMTAYPGFRWEARRPDDWRQQPEDWPETRYQVKARAAGRPPAFLRFRKQAWHTQNDSSEEA